MRANNNLIEQLLFGGKFQFSRKLENSFFFLLDKRFKKKGVCFCVCERVASFETMDLVD